TLSTYFPEYRRDVADAVTIRQLLGHSAGVPDLVHRSDIMQILKEPATPQEVVSKYCSNALEFTPGGPVQIQQLRLLNLRCALRAGDRRHLRGWTSAPHRSRRLDGHRHQ